MTKRISLLALALVVSSGVLAQSQQAVRDQLFGPTDALKKEADAVHAKLLGPHSYAEAMELYKDAGDTLEKGKDLNSAKEDLAKADGLFKKSTDAAKLAQVTFATTLTARQHAEAAEAAKYAAKDWGKAEDKLKDAAETLEDGNLNKANKTAEEAAKAYKSTESKAINAKAKAAH